MRLGQDLVLDLTSFSGSGFVDLGAVLVLIWDFGKDSLPLILVGNLGAQVGGKSGDFLRSLE